MCVVLVLVRVGHRKLRAQLEASMTQYDFYYRLTSLQAIGMLVDPTGRQRLWTPRRCTLLTLLIKERFVFPPLTVAAPYWGIHEGLTSSHSVRSERKNIFCLSCTLPPSCSLFASLSCCGAQLSLLLRAIYAKVNAVRCTSAIEFQGFRKNRITRVCEGARLRFNSSPPGNQEVGGSGCEGKSNAPTGSCQSLDELEFVWCLRADGEKLLCASHRDPSDRQVLQLSTQRLLVYTVQFFAHCSSDASRKWQCALLDRSAVPSDAAHSAADNTQTLLDPVCYRSRIFPTGEYCKKSH